MLRVDRLEQHVGDGTTVVWLVYEEGKFGRPLLALSDFEMDSLIGAVEDHEAAARQRTDKEGRQR